MKQCGQCTLSLLAGLSGSGRDREEACLEHLWFLMELEEAIWLPELLSSSTPDTQVAITARTEAETVSSDLGMAYIGWDAEKVS